MATCLEQSTSNTQSNFSSKLLIEDLIILWLDRNLNNPENKNETQITKSFLRKTNVYFHCFSNSGTCFDYIHSIENEKILLIMSGSEATIHIERLNSFKKIVGIFIFCMQIDKYLPMKEKYSKIEDVVTEYQSLLNAINRKIELIIKPNRLFTVFNRNQRVNKYLTKENGSFIWFQLLAGVLQNLTSNDTKRQYRTDLMDFCENYYRNNPIESNHVEQFDQNYVIRFDFIFQRSQNALFWYSTKSFIYLLVNKGLMNEDIEMILGLRGFIVELRNRMTEEHRKSCQFFLSKKISNFRVYRSLKMKREEFDHFKDHHGDLLAFKGFLSTTANLKQAENSAKKRSTRNEIIGILLEIEINLQANDLIFANLSEINRFRNEEEYLFDLSSVFRIIHIEYDQNKDLWIIKLTGAGDSVFKTMDYILDIRQEFQETNPIFIFGRLMCDLGEYEKSKDYFLYILSKFSSTFHEKDDLYYHLGRVSYFSGEYEQAIKYCQNILDPIRSSNGTTVKSFLIAKTLKLIGNIYLDEKLIRKSFQYFEQSLEMIRELLMQTPNHPSMVNYLLPIGIIHQIEGDQREALRIFKQCHQIQKISLSINHPAMADLFHCLAKVYEEIHDDNKALKYYTKSLKIRQIAFSSTHPLIMLTQNQIGNFHLKRKEFSKASSYFSQVFRIQTKSSSCETLDSIEIYENLFKFYSEQEKFDEALQMIKLKLNVLRKFFNDDDPLLQDTQMRINRLETLIKHHR